MKTKRKAAASRNIKRHLGNGLAVTQIGGIVSGEEQGQSSIGVQVYRKGEVVYELNDGFGRMENDEKLLKTVRKALTDSVAFIDRVVAATADS